MALALDKTAEDYEYNTSTTGCSVSLAAASSNSVAIIFVAGTFSSGGENWANTPTVNGIDATQYGTSYNWSGTQWMKVYYYLNPPTSSVAYTTSTDTIGADRDVSMKVHIYSGANQSSLDSFNTGTATGNLTLSTTVVASNCWLVSVTRNANIGQMGAGTGTTIRQNTTLNSSGDSNGTVGTGSQSMGWTAASGTSAGIIVSIAPSVASTFVPRVSFIM